MGFVVPNMVQCAGEALVALACFWFALKCIEGKIRGFGVYHVQKRTPCTLKVENQNFMRPNFSKWPLVYKNGFKSTNGYLQGRHILFY